jgi:hypothetical protein
MGWFDEFRVWTEFARLQGLVSSTSGHSDSRLEIEESLNTLRQLYRQYPEQFTQPLIDRINDLKVVLHAKYGSHAQAGVSLSADRDRQDENSSAYATTASAKPKNPPVSNAKKVRDDEAGAKIDEGARRRHARARAKFLIWNPPVRLKEAPSKPVPPPEGAEISDCRKTLEQFYSNLASQPTGPASPPNADNKSDRCEAPTIRKDKDQDAIADWDFD